MEFERTLAAHGLALRPLRVDTLQVNLGKLCNQACRHCHVDAGPARTEQMSRKTVDRCLDVLRRHSSIRTLDLTGGAPELNDHFEHIVTTACGLGREVMVRHNLTVTLDPHPVSRRSMAFLLAFFREHRVHAVASLPYFQDRETDAQRGGGVFRKSVEAVRRLNDEGFGIDGTGLALDLVANPTGAFLAPPQAALEHQFRAELRQRHGIEFTRLLVLNNMPISRFRAFLERADLYDEYMTRLMDAFNPRAADGVMCRSLISVGYDGVLYDCDFNQMLGLTLGPGTPRTIWDFDVDQLLDRGIVFDAHCFGCTAGGGSSCGGALVETPMEREGFSLHMAGD